MNFVVTLSGEVAVNPRGDSKTEALKTDVNL